jgi:hypothetical protein
MGIELIDKWASVLVCMAWAWLSIRTTNCLRTITRGTVAHTRRIVWLIKIVATLIAASNIFGVALEFHLHRFPSAALAGLVVLFALTDKVEAIVPMKPAQGPSAYVEAWREYSRLRKTAIRPVILLVIIGLLGIGLAAELESRLTQPVLTVLFWIIVSVAVVLFLIFLFNEWNWNTGLALGVDTVSGVFGLRR